MSDVHVVYTHYGSHGWGISSPQAPELVGGAKVLEGLRQETPRILRLANLNAENPTFHIEHHVTAPSGTEYLIRAALDTLRDRESLMDRLVVGTELGITLEEDRERMATLPTGEHLVLCTLPDDTLGWVKAQLAPGEGIYIAHLAEDDVLYGIPLHGDGSGRGTDLDNLNLTDESTIREAVDMILANEVGEMSIHHLSAQRPANP